MVSYMYQYENGIKKKNVGYARIEARNGQCKFTLRMQMLGQPDSIFPTYLIHRDDNNTELIYLGDSLLKNNVIDSKHFANEKDINDSGYGLSDIGGIVLFLNTDVFYATEWDDKPIIAKEIMAAIKPKSNKETKKRAKVEENVDQLQETPKSEEMVRKEGPYEAEKAPVSEEAAKLEEAPASKENAKLKEAPVIAEKKEETSKDNEVVKKREAPVTEVADRKEDDSKVDEIVKKEEPTIADEVIKVEKEQMKEKVIEDRNVLTAAEEAKIPKYKLPRGWKTVERLQNNPYANTKMINLPKVDVAKVTIDKTEVNISSEKELVQEAQMAKETKISKETKTSQDKNFEQKLEIVKDKESTEKKVVEKKEAAQEKEVAQVTDRSKSETAEKQIKSNAQVTMNRVMKKPNMIPDSPIAVRFFKSFPRINPFEDNEIIQCVKIEPKDIGLLPKELWGLSNNSFLLHGYYSYRHLIFAKMMDRSGIQYIIGVPGTYHSKEKFIARMFGFDCFKPAKKRELRQGDFGYWYVAISI